MIDKIKWLHISDLHLKAQSASWSQDVVLRALHKAVSDRAATSRVDFVLATGDLSYSGKRDEFIQVETFFNVVLKDLGLSSGDLFVVPGNHDNDLSSQKYSVTGARTILRTSGLADELIGDSAEREQILSRQNAYREFVTRFFPAGLGTVTPDGLAYVATKSIPPLRLSIIGLNSAWLCQSGRKDRGNVVVGERQLIEAIDALRQGRPHFVVALIHHPTFWLCEFEHKAVEERLRQSCDFVLRGHLHETDIQTHVVGDRRCMFVAAGASFETRESRNSFNYVELDIGQGTCAITSFNYEPSSGAFVESAPHNDILALRHLPRPSASAQVEVIRQIASDLSPISAYLACLLRGDKSEFLAFSDGRASFLSLDALKEQGSADLRLLTQSFLSLRNLCCFADDQTELVATLSAYRSRLYEYGQRLLALSGEYSAVREALATRNKEAVSQISAGGTTGSHYTVEMLRDLRKSSDLATLEQLAARNLNHPDPRVQREAARGLAKVLASSSREVEERQRAAATLLTLCDSSQSEAEDFSSLIQVLIDLNQIEQAKNWIRNGLKRFPEKSDGFTDLGMTLVKITGDRAFRDEMLEQKQSRRAR